jgi:hypothetical protein
MKSVAKSIVAGLFWISTTVSAQPAVYDPVSGILSLGAVKVGSDTYTNVTLLNIGNLTFRLKTATQQLPPGPAAITYDGAAGILNIPVVQLGSASYTSVMLQNIGNYAFTVGAATFSSAEGAWKGTTPDGRAISGGILDDGSLYFIYSPPGNPNGPGGLVVGNGVSVNGVFTSSNLVDFNLEGRGVLSGTLAANYVLRQSLNGTITHAGTAFAVNFTDAYDPNYDSVPSLALIAGSYSGQGVIAAPIAFENLTLTISPSGVFSSTDAIGCSRSGQVAVHARGDVYDATFTEGANCPFTGQTFSGIAAFNTKKNQLVVIVTNSPRTTAFVFAGSRM